MRQQNGCSLSIHFPFLLIDGVWPCALSPSVSRRAANKVAVTLQEPRRTPSRERIVPPVKSLSIHPSVRPLGSGRNPFSDCWLVAKGFLNRASGCWPWRGHHPKRKENPPPSPDHRRKYKTKEKLRLFGLWRLVVAVDEHTFMSLIPSLDVCLCVFDDQPLECVCFGEFLRVIRGEFLFFAVP